MRKFVRATYYLVGSLFFLAIAIAGFTQTKTFRSYLHRVLTDLAATELHGELTFDSLEGNLFTGFSIQRLSLAESGRPVLTADRLQARYEPLGFIVNRPTFLSIKLDNPRIQLVRSSDGTWNIGRLIPPPSADHTPSSTILTLRSVQLSNAEVVIVDSVKLMADREPTPESPRSLTDHPMLTLKALNFSGSLRVAPQRVDAAVRQFAFVSDQPAFVLSRLSGEFLLTKSDVGVKQLLVETPASRLTIDANLRNVDIVQVRNVRELEQKPVNLTLAIDRLSFPEIKQLFPTVFGSLDREIKLHARVAGTVGKLRVDNLVVQTPRSLLRVEGTVSNVSHPQDLEMDFVCLSNRIDPTEVPRYLPAAALPDLQSMGDLTYNLRFTGKPTAFKVRFEGTSKAGRLDADGDLQIQDGELSYDATVKTYNFDLGGVFNDKTLQSKLNSTINLKGSGTNLYSMKATAHAKIDSSEFYGLPFTASTVGVDVADKEVRSTIQLRSGAQQVVLHGVARLQEKHAPGYALEGTISSLNFASLLKDRNFNSDLSFTLEMQGRGLSFEDMHTNLSLVFAPSSFRGERFSQGWARAELNAADPQKQTFHLLSSIAEIDIDGKFRLDAVIATFHKGGVLLAEGIQHRIHSLDSLQRSSPSGTSAQVFKSSLWNIPEPVDARFVAKVKDLYPLGVFLGERISGKGEIAGEVHGSLDHLRFAGSARMDSFSYADSSVSLNLHDSDLRYRLDNISRTGLLDSVQAEITFAGSQLDVGNMPLYRPAFNVNIVGASGAYSMSALVDSSVGIDASGMSQYQDGWISYTLDNLQVNIQSHEFQNVEPVVLTLGRDGVRAEKFWMRHDAEEVKIAGSYVPNGASDLEIDVNNFLLSSLQRFSMKKSYVQEVRDLSGLVHARAILGGNLESPSLTLNLAAHGVRYGETVFGQIETRATYLDRTLNLFAEFRSRPDEPTLPPDFLISGTLPYDLSLKKGSDVPLTGEMDVTVRSKGFRLELFDPFIAELSNVSGAVVCDMKIRGTLEEPHYEGSVAIQSARFRFNPLGIMYVADGRLVPQGQRIALEDLRISNIPQDRSDGVMNIAGSFTLKGLKLRDFDFLANGQLLVMKESSRQPGQSIFGDLFAAAGSNGLHWRGTLQRSLVSGELRVKNAKLTLPPTREQLLRTSQDVTITVVDDTVNAPTGGTESGGQQGVGRNEGSATLALNTDSPTIIVNGTSSASTAQEKDERSFLDRLVYDLDVETQGPTQVRFIFNPYTGEELFAELKGRMAFAKDGEQMRLTGEVEVGDRSYYNFLKRFQANGKLTFIGDPLNPELNILARYEGAYQGKDTTLAATSTASRSVIASSGEVQPERVIVLLRITGTRKEPKPKFEIEVVNREGKHEQRTKGDVESDAIAFILAGSFRDDLTQQDRSSLLGSNLLYGLTSSVLSGPITDFIKKEFGFISSVDVIYYGGNIQSSTDVQVTGEIGEAIIRFGGRVFSDIGNTSASVQLPLSSVLGSEKWRNLVIEAERRVEGVESYEQRRESNGVRLLYRIVF